LERAGIGADADLKLGAQSPAQSAGNNQGPQFCVVPPQMHGHNTKLGAP